MAEIELELGGRRIRLETGRIARQAHGAVFVTQGGSAVLVTAVCGGEPRGGGFLPLTVEYREKNAAVGRIPGSFFRREGRINEHEVLVSRLIDRSLRPGFPDGFDREIQVMATVFSAGKGGDPASLALIGAGAAVALAGLPVAGPVLGCRSALVGGRTVLLPVAAERDEAEAELVVSIGPSGIVMVEGGARNVPEDEVLEHLFATAEALAAPRATLAEWTAEHARESLPFEPPAIPQEWRAALETAAGGPLAEALSIPEKSARRDAVARIFDRYSEERRAAGASEEELAAVPVLFKELQKEIVRRRILADGVRIDGRKPEEVRPISGEAGLLPRPHGSALFTRGETQALVTCTLGTSRDRQTVEDLEGRTEERFLLHYNFPPYSVGEIRPLRGPGRREIGHGHLARRALEPLLPGYDEFPYAIRIESDVTESNGSSSMATVCGGCLALMDAGVRLPAHVAGIAMGLVHEDGRTVVLTDILGDEDHLGDMDFKIAGTREGLTAVQMDNKIGALSKDVLEAAMAQARRGLDHVLDALERILPAARPEIAADAPQIHAIRIQPHLIANVIGPRGATIQRIQEETGASIEIDDDGLIRVYCDDGRAWSRVRAEIENLAGEVVVGATYDGVVTGVKGFGVFVRIFESAEGLVPSRNLGGRKPAEGSGVRVRVEGVDGRGRIVLSLV